MGNRASAVVFHRLPRVDHASAGEAGGVAGFLVEQHLALAAVTTREGLLEFRDQCVLLKGPKGPTLLSACRNRARYLVVPAAGGST